MRTASGSQPRLSEAIRMAYEHVNRGDRNVQVHSYIRNTDPSVVDCRRLDTVKPRRQCRIAQKQNSNQISGHQAGQSTLCRGVSAPVLEETTAKDPAEMYKHTLLSLGQASTGVSANT